jgi:hypothetical protein
MSAKLEAARTTNAEKSKLRRSAGTDPIRPMSPYNLCVLVANHQITGQPLKWSYRLDGCIVHVTSVELLPDRWVVHYSERLSSEDKTYTLAPPPQETLENVRGRIKAQLARTA